MFVYTLIKIRISFHFQQVFWCQTITKSTNIYHVGERTTTKSVGMQMLVIFVAVKLSIRMAKRRSCRWIFCRCVKASEKSRMCAERWPSIKICCPNKSASAKFKNDVHRLLVQIQMRPFISVTHAVHSVFCRGIFDSPNFSPLNHNKRWRCIHSSKHCSNFPNVNNDLAFEWVCVCHANAWNIYSK